MMPCILGDVCDFINGGAWSDKEYVESGLPVLKVTNCKNSGFVLDTISYLSMESAEKYAKNKLNVGDVIIATVGSHPNLKESAAGRASIVDSSVKGFYLNQNAVCLRTKDASILSQGYLGYLSKTHSFQHYIQMRGRGAANQMRIAISSIKEYSFDLPCLALQCKIADILSAYDNLIENNQKQIKLLEDAAQRLYKQWFIDLRFPGHETTPIVDGLPKGWKKCRIDERFKTVLGGTPSRANPNYWNGNIAWINSGEVNNLRIMKASEYITELALEKSATKMMPVHTTVLAITGATLGQVSYTEIETCANQSVVGIIDETELFSMYLYLFVSTNIKSMIGKATGGAQQHINKDIVNEYKIILPEERVIKKMNILASPLFNKIADCYRQIEKLTESRDRLLPKLMNGELEV